MSEVTIKWLQRVAGYEIGDEVTVERTAFIDAVIAQGRVEVIAVPADAVVGDRSEAAPAVEPESKPAPRPAPPRRGNFEAVPDGAAEAE